MKETIIIVMGILLLVSVSAMYAGQTKYVDLTNKIQNLQSINCSIINSTYNLEGLNFSFNNTGYLISTSTDYKPDNLTILCFLNGEKYVSSGGSNYYSPIIKQKNKTFSHYECSSWTNCINGKATRKCYIDGTSKIKENIPDSYILCKHIEKNKPPKNNTIKFNPISKKNNSILNYLIDFWNWLKSIFSWI